MNSMIVQLLSEAGYEAQGAQNGSCGLKLLKRKPFDRIVTDIIMPEKEGLKTILTIRRSNSKIPIIAISGGGKISPEECLDLSKQLGADYSFKKPFGKERLLGEVRECLSEI